LRSVAERAGVARAAPSLEGKVDEFVDPDAYEDPDLEAHWCAECREQVVAYLKGEGVAHGPVGEWPAWHAAPYVSLWAVESLQTPGVIGWWAICGDLPTDYISAAGASHPRDAMRVIAQQWRKVASVMAYGEQLPDHTIGSREDGPSLAPLLEGRAKALAEWADDDALWQEPDGPDDDSLCEESDRAEEEPSPFRRRPTSH
jgi:hypothetical protein